MTVIDVGVKPSAPATDGDPNADLPSASAHGMLWDAVGGQWVRAAPATARMDTSSLTGILGVAQLIYNPNTALWNRAMIASGDGLSVPPQGVNGMVYNGSTWDRARAAKLISIGSLGQVGVPAVGPQQERAADGNFYTVRSPDNDAQANHATASSGNQLFNEATYDRQRGNTEGTLLALAARTATTGTASQKNYNARGVVLFVRVTVAGTGNLLVRPWGVDPVSGVFPYLAQAPGAIVGSGSFILRLYPGANASGAPGYTLQVTSDVLPRTWGVDVVHSDSSSWTYSVGYSLVV